MGIFFVGFVPAPPWIHVLLDKGNHPQRLRKLGNERANRRAEMVRRGEDPLLCVLWVSLPVSADLKKRVWRRKLLRPWCISMME